MRLRRTLYGPTPRLVARCEIDQSGKEEAKLLNLMKGVRGIVQHVAYIPHSKQSCEIFLEYYNSGTLHQLLTRQLVFHDKELLPVMKDLLIGLKTLHDKGYMHRDIKRGNILLHREHGKISAVLGDLGLAFPIHTHPEWRLAVPDENCSPEVLLKPYCQIDRNKAEAYSLGVLFYLMIFSEKPPWYHLIHQDTLPQKPRQNKQKTYQNIQRLYNMSVQFDPKYVHGVRKKALIITLQMLHPDPVKRSSLEQALTMGEKEL